jgi:hypothetical protein
MPLGPALLRVIQPDRPFPIAITYSQRRCHKIGGLNELEIIRAF